MICAGYAYETWVGLQPAFRGNQDPGFCAGADQGPDVPADYDEKLYGDSREEHAERLRNTPIHLCRLRYFSGTDSWSLAFFSYSSEAYEPCLFPRGSWTGTPEEAFETSALYLGG